MPRYMVLARTFLHAVGTSGPGLHEAGATIEFDGAPGVSLFPLDAGARAARAQFLDERHDRGGLKANRDALMVRRYRRGLPPQVIAILDRAEAEAAAETAAAAKAGGARG